MKIENKYEKLIERIIGGDHLDTDTLIELMVETGWTADDVANELGEDFREQAQAVGNG
tara:strand:- start:1332 stop:1505 length:174 start_codon:yes stop_codon:yes gene_type:complete